MPSFDIVSKAQMHEVDNALQQAQKEIAQRYDFKDTETTLEKTADGLVLRSSSEERLKAAFGVLSDKLVKRKVSLKFLDAQKIEESGKIVRQLIKLKDGVDIENAREIVKRIKDSKLKVQASIQEQQVRVSGKSRDDLQSVIALIRAAGLNIELSFVNFRD